jgi:hypothetical protein
MQSDRPASSSDANGSPVVPHTESRAWWIIVAASCAGFLVAMLHIAFNAAPAGDPFSMAIAGTPARVLGSLIVGFTLIALVGRYRVPVPTLLIAILALVIWKIDEEAGVTLAIWGTLTVSLISFARSRTVRSLPDAAAHSLAASAGWLAGLTVWMIIVDHFSTRARGQTIFLLPAVGALGCSIVAVRSELRRTRSGSVVPLVMSALVGFARIAAVATVIVVGVVILAWREEGYRYENRFSSDVGAGGAFADGGDGGDRR